MPHQGRDRFELGRQPLTSFPAVMLCLQTKPQTGATAAQLTEAHRHVRRYRRFPSHDPMKQLATHPEMPRDLGDRNPKSRKRVLGQDLPRMDFAERVWTIEVDFVKVAHTGSLCARGVGCAHYPKSVVYQLAFSPVAFPPRCAESDSGMFGGKAGRPSYDVVR